MKVIIVGGVAGGASAAARLRRLNEDAQIVVFERSGYVSYANCGLPYYVGGTITDREALTLQTPESFKRRFNVDVRVRCEVRRIDPVRKTVTVCDLSTGAEYEESYDRLILSPGARPVRPGIPGVESERVYTLRTVEDTLKLRAVVERTAPGAQSSWAAASSVWRWLKPDAGRRAGHGRRGSESGHGASRLRHGLRSACLP